MLSSTVVKAGDAALLGVRLEMPNAPVLMLVGKKGFVGCGYFDIAVADKVSHAVAVVAGVKSFDDMLAGSVKSVSNAASQLGIRPGMTGAEAATRLA